MKLSVSKIRQIIKEELARLNEYGQEIVRRGRHLYIVDDEGNEEYYGPASDMPGMRDGESEDYEPEHRRRKRTGGYFNNGREPWERDRW